MIPGKALAEWLENRREQALTNTAREECRRELAGLEPIARLNREIDAAPEDDAEALLACGRRFLEEPDSVGSCLDLLNSFARRDFFFRPPLPSLSGEVHTGLLLLDRPKLTMLLAVASPDALATKRKIRRGRASIAFPGALSVYKFVKAGGATLSFWETSGPAWEGRDRCRFVERRPIGDGEILELDGRYQGFVVDHAEGDMVYIHSSTPAGAAPLVAEYDSGSLEFIGGSSADEANSRTLMMLSLLRLMNRTDSASLFREALGSSHFYARWHAMREYLALDMGLALPHLRKMAEADPHPEVRVAAARTLETFFGGEALNREGELECLA